MKNTPSAEQALFFDQCMARWQQVLHLGDWRIERGQKPAKQAMASVEFNEGARLAIYRLGDFGAEQITEKSLDDTALHESLHILLHDLIDTAQDRSAEPEKLEAAEHRVINVLERVLSRS
jgi:hypothetical protein